MAAPKRYVTKDPKTGRRIPSNLPKASMDSGNLPVKAAKTAAGGSGAKTPVRATATANASGKSVVPSGSRGVRTTGGNTSSTARTVKDMGDLKTESAKKAPTASKAIEAAKTAGKSGVKLGTAVRLGSGLGMLAYSKDAGKGSDFKGTNARPAAFSGLGKIPAAAADSAPAPVKKVVSAPAKKAAPQGESQSSKDGRMAAYEKWVKTNRDPFTKSYLSTGNASKAPDMAGRGLKNGGKTKCMANGGSTGRGDGIASKGKTKCKYV